MADGSIKIDIEVNGKQVIVAAKELDKLEESGLKVGKGVKAAEDSMDSLGDSSAKASKDVKGASDSLDDLGDSGSKTSKDLKGADVAIDDLADSSADASKGVKGTSDSLDDLGDSGTKASQDLKGVDGAIDGLADSSADAAKGADGAADRLDGLGDSAEDAAGKTKKMKDEAEGVGNETDKASGKTKKFAISLGLIAVAAGAFAVLKSSMDTAIARFDTLNKFPKVLQAIGVSAEESEHAMTKLGDGIDGLPTTLNEIAANAQRMYTSFNDMDKATDTALALNNAMLGSGSSAADAQRGTEQYLQALQKGKFEMEEWKTLQETMDIGLIKVAESFGFAGRSAKNDLYDALKDGSITMDEFNNKLIEVGTGTGVMAGLAKENSLGMATSISNLKNAAARGLAGVIASFDKLAKEVTGKDIAQNIDGLKVVVNSAFKVIGRVIEGTAPIVKGFAAVVKGTIPIVQALSPAIIGLMSAYAAHTVIMKAQAAISAANAIIKVAMASTSALTLATTLGTTATGADTVAKAAQAGMISFTTLAIGVMTGAITLSTAATVVATTVTYLFGAAIKFLMGPVGWVIAGIGLLVAGVVALVKWFKKSTAEGERLGKETEELAESTGELSSSVADSSKAYEKNQKNIKESAKTSADLAKRIDELSKKENKSAADKKELNSYIEELNRSVDGLNLVYGEEADALSMSSEQMMQRITLMEKQEELNAAQERLTEIMREQNEVGTKLGEINTLREEWNQKLDDGSVKSREHKAALEELAIQEAALSEANTLAGEERVRVEAEIAASAEAVAAATEASTGRQKLMFEELPKAQQAAVETMKAAWEEYKAAASDMFDRLSEKSEISIGKMTKNLEENQRIIGEWADNIAILASRGVDEGLLETLRAAGPSSAGHVKELVNASDTELMRLSDAFAKAGPVATDALVTSIGQGADAVMTEVGHLVTSAESSLKRDIAAADFKSIGGDVAKGLAGGITENTKEATDASKKMADDTTDATKDAFQTKSPSRKFKEIGKSLPDGLVLGVNSGTNAVIQAMKKLSKASIDQFNDSPKQFKQIGVNSMLGLNEGLLAGRSRVLATARNIANSIASTMQTALRIHSPSQRFRDEVGKMIPAGVAIGIEDNAKSVYKALDQMSRNMISFSTPEIALGTGSMARNAMPFSGGSSPGGSGGSNVVTNNTPIIVKELIVREEADLDKIARGLYKMQKGNGRVVLG